MALVDTGAEYSLVYGKPEEFPGSNAHTDGDAAKWYRFRL